MVCSKSHTSPHVHFNAAHSLRVALILTRYSCPKSRTAFSHFGEVMTANTGIFTTCQEPDHTSYTEECSSVKVTIYHTGTKNTHCNILAMLLTSPNNCRPNKHDWRWVCDNSTQWCLMQEHLRSLSSPPAILKIETSSCGTNMAFIESVKCSTLKFWTVLHFANFL